MGVSVGTGLVIFNNEGEVLLVKETKEKRGGHADKWGIVGGMLEPDQTLEENAKKEALEETGFDVSLLGFNATYQHVSTSGNRLSFIFIAKCGEKLAKHYEHEISDLAFFKPVNIPYDDLRFPHNAEMIKDAVDMYEKEIFDLKKSNVHQDKMA